MYKTIRNIIIWPCKVIALPFVLIISLGIDKTWEEFKESVREWFE